MFRPQVSEDAAAAAAETMRSGWIALGPKTRAFETAFAEYVDAPFCIGVDSGTSAIHLGLRLLDLQEKPEVITTALTFVASNQAILHAGGTPVWADVQPRTGNIDPRSIESAITDRTGAILCVHYGGYPCDLDEIYAVAERHDVPVVEDCAHAGGATYKGRRIGSHGEIHAFSFGPLKNIPTPGGGAVTVTSEERRDRLGRLRALGVDRRSTDPATAQWNYDVAEIGYRAHMNDVSSSIALVHLDRLDKDNHRRAEIADMYRARLNTVAGVTLPVYENDRASSYHLFPILVDDRAALLAKLAQADIEAGVHYRRNDELKLFERAELPHTDEFSKRQVTLPMHLLLSDEDVDCVCTVIQSGW